MKVFSLGLAVCAALAVSTASVEAKGIICETGSGFADTGDSATVSSSTGSDATKVVASSSTDGSDATQVAGSSSTATGSDDTIASSSMGSDVTQVDASSSTAVSDAASSSTFSDDTPVTTTSSRWSDASTTSQETDDSTTQGSVTPASSDAEDGTTSSSTKGGADSAVTDVDADDDTTSASRDESGVSSIDEAASTSSDAISTKGNTGSSTSNGYSPSLDAENSASSSPNDANVTDSSEASQTGQQDVVDTSVGSSKASASGSTTGQQDVVDSSVESSKASSSSNAVPQPPVTRVSASASGSSTDSTPTQSSASASSVDSNPTQASTAASSSSTDSTPTQEPLSSSGSSGDSTAAQTSVSGSIASSTPTQGSASSSAASTATPTIASSSTSSDSSTAASASAISSFTSSASTDVSSTSASASASTSSSVSYSPSSSSSTFTKVTRLGVRVQGDMPAWNDEHERFVSAYYDTFDEKYQAVLDTVNMASVEGALKYVQAECINASAVTDCERKNDIKYVVFYQTTVVQPTTAMKYYVNATDEYDFAVESCPFMAMDGGQCDPNEDGSFPDVCNQYIGADGQPELGFCVGGTLQDNEAIAPYPHNYWFSFPNSCPQELWDDKTASCREEHAGGMCALGVEPDGVNCTYSYEILGYILLDDVVGITSMVNPLTGSTYADYYEFCEAGGIEFSVSIVSSLLGDLVDTIVDLVEGLEFWANPGDSDANAARVEKLVSAYDTLVSTNATTSDGGLMHSLPTVDKLTALNPPCYENSPLCAESEFGCKRSYRSQICQVCTSDDSGCEKA